MDVSPLTMLLFFLPMTVIVAVHELGVIVLVRMPMGAVLPLTERTAAVVMGDVVMVVRVHLRRMRVLGFFALALSTLHFRHLLGVCSCVDANLEAVGLSQSLDPFADFLRAVETSTGSRSLIENQGLLLSGVVHGFEPGHPHHVVSCGGHDHRRHCKANNPRQPRNRSGASLRALLRVKTMGRVAPTRLQRTG